MDDLSPTELELVNRRAQAFKRTGDPGILWPGITETARLAALAEIESCVGQVLSHGQGGCGGERPTRLSGDAEAIGIAALTSGMGPLLGAWAERSWLTVSPETGEVLSRHLAHGRARAERLDRGLSDALDALATVGVTATLLKGAHTARVYYPEPGARAMSDVDVFVPARSRRTAERALSRAGWTRGTRQRRPYKCDWQPPGMDRHVRSFAYLHAFEPWCLELHVTLDRNFAPGRHARLPLGPGGDEPSMVSGRQVRVLRPALNVAYLAAHASEESHAARLLRVVELVLVCRTERASGRLDWAELAAVLDARAAAGFVYPAFAFAERLAPGTIDNGLLNHCAAAAGPRVRAFVDASTAGDHSRLERVRLAEKFIWSRGPLDNARRLGLMLWPKSGGTLGDLVRTYARRVFRLSHGRVE